MFQDKALICKDCGQEFTFTSGEQEFYAQKGFTNEPTRCKSCRDSKKAERGGRRDREFFTGVCAECGGEAKLPFKPRDDRPVYCSDCFSKHQNG